MRRLVLGAAALLVALNAVVQGERLRSVLASYRLFITEGGEGPHIYAIWRLLHGFPLYQWPQREPYALTLYNALFYHSYAGVLGAFGVDGPAILLAARLITLAAALAGAVTSAALMLRLLPPDLRSREVRATVVLFAAVLWLGTNFASWWPLSIRPDVAAMVFATLGLTLVIRALSHSRSGAALMAASVLFFVAWGFKQTVVLTFAGTLVYLMFSPRWKRDLPALALPFVALAALAVGAGGATYRFNILTAGTAGHILPSQALAIFARVFAQNALVWVLPLVLGALAVWSRMCGSGTAAPVVEADRLLATVFAVTLFGGLVALGRESANENQLYEAYLSGGLIAARGIAVLVARAAPAPRRVGVAAAVLLSLPMLAFPAAQIAFPDRFGVTHLASPADLERKRALAERLPEYPKPLFIVDDVLAQPWNANAGRYPAFVLDVYWTALAERDGLLPHGMVEGLIRGGRFRTVVDAPGGRYAIAAAASGLRCDGVPDLAPDAAPLVACTSPATREQTP